MKKLLLLTFVTSLLLISNISVIANENTLQENNEITSDRNIAEVEKSGLVISSRSSIETTRHDQVTSKQTSTSSNKFSSEKYKLTSQGTSSTPPVSTLATTIDRSVEYNETLTINAILKSVANVPWDGETVKLYRTNDLTKESIITTLDQATIDASPATYLDTGLTDVTDVSGNYIFDLTFISADIDVWIYFAYFGGNLPFRLPAVVYIENISVTDTTDFFVTVDKTNVGPTEIYTYTVQGTALSGASLQTLQVDIQENFGFGDNGNEFLGNVVLDASGVGTISKSYGSTGLWGTNTEDTITLTLSIPVQSAFNDTVFPAGASIPTPTITVTIDYTFTAQGNIDGTDLLLDPTAKYYRAGQTLSFNATYMNQSFAGDLTAWQTALSSKQINVAITGAGTTLTLGPYSTDNNGFISFTTTFDTTNFPNLNLAIETQILITLTIVGVTTVADTVETFSLFVKEDLQAITASDTSPEVYYHPDSPTITVTGTVLDNQGAPAKFVPVVISINNKTAPVPVWNSQLIEQVLGTTTTGDGGAFSFDINNFNFAILDSVFTINVTLGAIGLATDWTQIGVDTITDESSSFNYYSSITTYIQIDLKDGNGYRDLNASNTLFNDTFVNYYNNNANYSIGVRDQFGNNPVGLTISVVGRDGTIPFTVTAGTANFTFIFSDVVNFDQLLFNTSGSNFNFAITFANNIPTLASTVSENFILMGPDNVAPALTGNPSFPGNLETGVDARIEATIDVTKSDLDNIRFVVLFYKVSTNTAHDLIDANFPVDFTSVLMTDPENDGTYNFTISFDEHGRWIEFYVEVADLAGYGLVGLYPSATVLPSGYPSYTNSFSLNVSSIVQTIKMGDTEIIDDNNFDYVDAINVNFQPLTQNTNVDPGEDIIIDLRIPIDNVDYANMTFSYQILTFDSNGTLINNGTFTDVFILGINFPVPQNFEFKFQFTIDGTSLDYFMQVNYNFTIYDINDNEYKSPQIINAVDNSSSFNTLITDEDNPEDPDPTRDWEAGEDTLDKVNTPTTKQVYNLNETGYVSYNITDAGIGISNITLTMYYYDGDGNLLATISKLLVDDSVILFPGGTDLPVDISNFLLFLSQISNNGTYVNVTESGGEYFMQFYVDFDSLPENMTVSWDVTANDVIGNEIVVNSQGADPLKFEIINPPEEVTDPLQTVSTILSTDSDGNVITIVSTISNTIGDQEEEDSGNALLVILTFSLFVFAIALYYQRHNIREYFEKSARKRKARSTLSELIDEIKRLGAEEKYKAAIRLVWEALERLSKEILQVPRSYNQTAREFTSYLSTITIVDRETLLTISNAFEAAKYGKDEPTYDDWDDAVKALDITVNTIIESGARVQIEDDDDEFD
ncbi:MAG: DUF4129 domain-containing protein [Candidatus Heimdallarchaeota archaeon]|nr:DUF4129 domain-containing protein [Candidatus Heimdallarchaeota archaeon]